jgi:periplasmic divalent cation tolerance protein
MADALLVTTTLPDASSARAMARHLVEAGLAACVQQLPAIASVYRWDGAVEEASEVLLLIKTTPAAYDAVQDAIAARHPYELPQILAFDAATGFPPYLRWLADAVSPT